MRMKSLIRQVVACAVSGFALSACVSYSPSEISAMSTYDLCKTQSEQGFGLAENSRGLLQSELTRRKEDCRIHRAAIQGERDDKLYDLTYGTQSP